MQLYCSFSGVVSSRSSSYVGRSLQVHPASWGCALPASSCVVGVRAEKADLWQLLGGRGLAGGEEGLKNESKSKVLFGAVVKEEAAQEIKVVDESDEAPRVDEDAAGFEKEMMGLTGGFPGGETGLQRFIATSTTSIPQRPVTVQPPPQQRPRAPPPPLLMPGMTVIVKNPRHPFHMYSGTVQRVSDGRVGVLFEGGNWDKLQTFYLEDLERTPRGPPMINPKSAILLQTKPPA